jgi:hypothetical protein
MKPGDSRHQHLDIPLQDRNHAAAAGALLGLFLNRCRGCSCQVVSHDGTDAQLPRRRLLSAPSTAAAGEESGFSSTAR